MLGCFDKIAFRFEKKHFTPPELIESLTGTIYKHLTPNGVRGRLFRAIFFATPMGRAKNLSELLELRF